MSYDVYVGRESFNYTSNLARLFYDHMPPDENSDRGGLHTLHGCTGRKAGDKISSALDRIWRNRVGEPGLSAKYDAPNGWGSAVGAILFLSLVMAACYQNPRSKVTLSA